MKRLTINHIASASVRVHRRSYIALALGLFLSIFLITAFCLCIHSLYLAQQAQRTAAYGTQDVFLPNCMSTDEQLMETGLFSQIGHVYVTAWQPEGSLAVGYYDDTAEALLARTLLEGRMPEAPGEAALEQSALERLRIQQLQPGDSLTLSLTPPGGVPEERTFTIVGILSEQSLNFSSGWHSLSPENTFPAIVLYEDEPAFASGYTVLHAVFRLAPAVTAYQALRYHETGRLPQELWAIDPNGHVTSYAPNMLRPNDDLLTHSVYVLLLACSLLLATCIGIAGAMDSQLARKSDQIGMLRAVGATRRQIRQIFGREAWLLAMMVSPLSVALACAAVWLLHFALSPSVFLFRPHPVVLLPIVLLSMLIILLASAIPLRRACKIMPIAVIRDAGMLRRIRQTRPLHRFRPSLLLAWRQLNVRPMQQVAPTMLMFLMFLVVSLTFEAVLGIVRSNMTALSRQPSFTLSCPSIYHWSLVDSVPQQTLTAADILQLRSLPGVTQVDVCGSLYVTQALSNEDIPTYLQPHPITYQSGMNLIMQNIGLGHDLMLPEQERTTGSLSTEINQNSYDAARTLFGAEGHLVFPITLQVTPIDDASLSPFLVSGSINTAAINAGQEVIVYAPDISVWESEDGQLNFIESSWDAIQEWMAKKDVPYRLLAKLENDAYTAGQTLSLHYLYTSEQPVLSSAASQQEYEAYLSGMTHCSVHVTVGAVVNGGEYFSKAVTIATSEQGLAQMGLPLTRVNQMEIYTHDLTSEEEASLDHDIRAIAMRGANLEVVNHLKSKRERGQAQIMTLLLFSGISLIFFALCVAQISGSVSRRVRADVRMIGTLRAVGANARVIFHCYSAQVMMQVLFGTLLGLGVFWLVLTRIPNFMLYSGGVWRWASLGIQVLFAAAALVASLGILRLRISDVTSRTIVENIREL